MDTYRHAAPIARVADVPQTNGGMLHMLAHRFTTYGYWTFVTHKDKSTKETMNTTFTCVRCGFMMDVTWKRGTSKKLSVSRHPHPFV